MISNVKYTVIPIFLSLIILYQIPVNGYIFGEAKIYSTINYPYSASYIGLKANCYEIVDIDHDGNAEALVILKKVEGYLVNGVLLIIDNSGIRETRYFKNFMPYDIIVYRSKIVLLGYFLNISTYGVIVLNSDLDIIGWNALNNYYPLPCHDPFPGKPQIMDDKIIATLIIINYTNTTQSISKLIEIDMSNYIMEEIISLSRIYVIDDPLVIDDTIIWGPLILNRYFNIIHNLSNKIGFIITGVWNQLLMDNMLYMILSSYSTAYIVCLDTINYNVVRVINITSTPISKLIAINNTIIGYGETLTDHMEYNITLYRIMTDKLTPIEVFNTITNSTGITIFRQNSILLLTSKIIYIVSIDKNISGVILLPHNISFENRDLDIIVFDTGDYKIDIVLLDRSYMLFLRISLEETLIPLTQHIYVHLLIITTILSLISLKGIKRRIKEVKILDQLIP